MATNSNFDKFMQANSFKKKRKMYYKIDNDIMFFVIFEKTPSLIYCNFAFIPLYIPTENMYLTYGNRINNCSQKTIPLSSKADEDEKEKWLSEISFFLMSDVFPFWSKVSSPKKICQFIDSHRASEYKNFVFCPPDRIFKLYIYSKCYYSLKFDESAKCEYEKLISNNKYYTERIKTAEIEEMEKLKFAQPLDCSYWQRIINDSKNKLLL